MKRGKRSRSVMRKEREGSKPGDKAREGKQREEGKEGEAEDRE